MVEFLDRPLIAQLDPGPVADHSQPSSQFGRSYHVCLSHLLDLLICSKFSRTTTTEFFTSLHFCSISRVQFLLHRFLFLFAHLDVFHDRLQRVQTVGVRAPFFFVLAISACNMAVDPRSPSALGSYKSYCASTGSCSLLDQLVRAPFFIIFRGKRRSSYSFHSCIHSNRVRQECSLIGLWFFI